MWQCMGSILKDNVIQLLYNILKGKLHLKRNPFEKCFCTWKLADNKPFLNEIE